MVVPVDNVIRFPEGTRALSAEVDRPRTLVEARDLMAQKLREAFRSLLPQVAEEFLAKGDIAERRAQRELFYGTRDAIRDQALSLEDALAAQWTALFEQTNRTADTAKRASAIGDPEELQLVDFSAMDQELLVKAIAGRLRSSCDDGLFAAAHRLAFLSGQAEAALPVEDLIARSLDGAFESTALSGAAKLELLQAMERHAAEAFGSTIDDLNTFLVSRSVLPTLRRSYSPPSAEKKHSSETDQAIEAADIFALLQKLVQAQPASAAGGVDSAMIGYSDGVRAGMPLAKAPSSGNMAIAMEQVMASLDGLQRVVPMQASAALMDNVLRDFRSSDTGQGLDYLHAVTVDIVATLFGFIFDDPSVADPIKALVARLQIPVLKVAMLDKTFFSSKTHPARRLLDGISRAAVRCGPEAGHDNPLYARLTEIIERLQNEFKQDTGLFDTLCIELDAFLDSQEATANARAVQAAPLVEAQERQELAVLAVDQALGGWLARPLPAAVLDLLAHEWRTLLIRQYLGKDDASWGMAMGTVSELVASVEPQPDMPSRKRLASRLPTLVRRICDGLDGLEMAEDRRRALIDGLFTVHAGVLRGAAPPVMRRQPDPPPAEPVPARITSEQIEQGETLLERISLAEGSALPASASCDDSRLLVAKLRRGDWVEFANAETGPLRYRLSWISPQRGILLFTNSQSPRAISVAPDALALQIERGDATILPLAPMFDRAVDRALEKLKAA